ncbi:hypothetical protein MMC12_005079 [Toensbergia leucococca]|nr:hypothetical protein [Toensbergia leucococca]
MASRASSRTSFTRRSTSRRPTIGTPSDFRRVELPRGRIGGFRPLELSIYLPGNELPLLPVFSEDSVEVLKGLEYPAQALVKSRSTSMSSRPSIAFTIPRKPLASVRTFSLDEPRCSVDSHFTLNGSTLLGLPQPLHHKPTAATSQSTREFLDALETRLPQSLPPSRFRFGPEPISTLHRRASDQNLRLRTHLEEREQAERRLQDCDTILEELQFDVERDLPGVKSISNNSDTKAEGLLSSAEQLPRRMRPSRSMTLPQLPNDSLRLLPSISKTTLLPYPPMAQVDIVPLQSEKAIGKVVDVERIPNRNPLSTRSRVSQWLLRSVSTHPASNTTEAMVPNTSFYQCQLSAVDDVASTVSSRSSNLSSVELGSPWTTPHSSPHKNKNSLSSCRTSVPGLGAGFDEGKPPGTGIGAAF